MHMDIVHRVEDAHKFDGIFLFLLSYHLMVGSEPEDVPHMCVCTVLNASFNIVHCTVQYFMMHTSFPDQLLVVLWVKARGKVMLRLICPKT